MFIKGNCIIDFNFEFHKGLEKEAKIIKAYRKNWDWT